MSVGFTPQNLNVFSFKNNYLHMAFVLDVTSTLVLWSKWWWGRILNGSSNNACLSSVWAGPIQGEHVWEASRKLRVPRDTKPSWKTWSGSDYTPSSWCLMFILFKEKEAVSIALNFCRKLFFVFRMLTSLQRMVLMTCRLFEILFPFKRFLIC